MIRSKRTGSLLATTAFAAGACVLGAPRGTRETPARAAASLPALEEAASYRLRLRDPARAVVEVEARFPPASKNDLLLRLDRRYAFLEVEGNYLRDLRASAGGIPLRVEAAGRDRWRVRGVRGEAVEVAYAVEVGHRDEIASRDRDKPDRYEHPYVGAEEAMLVGAAVFLHPEESTPKIWRVAFDLPDGWGVVAPWPGDGSGVFAPESAVSLTHNAIGLGRWRVERVEMEGFAADVAFAGRRRTEDLDTLETIEALSRAHLELLGPFEARRVLALFPRGGVPWGAGGSAKRDSLLLAFGPGATRDDLDRVIAHEFAHLLGPSFTEDLRWAGEGFADYLGALARARAGRLPTPRFLEVLARETGRYLEASRRTGLSLAEATPLYFEDRDAYDLAYAGGFVLAFLLDEATAGAGGFPAVIRALLRGRDGRTDRETLRRTVRAIAGEGVWKEIEAFAHSPAAAESLLAAFPERFAVRIEERPERQLGVEFEPGGPPRIARLDPRGPAARAGLLAGDRIVALDGKSVDSLPALFRARRAARGPDLRVVVERAGERIERTLSFALRPRVTIREVASPEAD